MFSDLNLNSTTISDGLTFSCKCYLPLVTGRIKIDIDIKVTLIAEIQRNVIDSDGNFPTQDAAAMETARLLSDHSLVTIRL